MRTKRRKSPKTRTPSEMGSNQSDDDLNWLFPSVLKICPSNGGIKPRKEIYESFLPPRTNPQSDDWGWIDSINPWEAVASTGGENFQKSEQIFPLRRLEVVWYIDFLFGEMNPLVLT